MSKRHPLFYAIILLVFASFACTSVTGLFSSDSPDPTESAGSAIQTNSPEVEPTPEATSEAEEPLPPSGFLAWIQQGVEDDLWTYQEGLIASLEFMTGQRSPGALPQDLSMGRLEGTGLARAALQYANQDPESPEAEQILELLALLAPAEERIDRYSVPADQSSFQGQPLTKTMTQGDAARCKNSWLENFPDTEGSIYQCFEARSETLSLGNSGSVDLKTYFPLAWSEDEEKTAYLDAAFEAATKSLQQYDGLGPVDNTTLYFSLLDEPDEEEVDVENFGPTAMTTLATFSQPLGESCPIYIHPYALDGDLEGFKQIVAHEVFHCYQFWNLNNQSMGPSVDATDWWLEGTADYYSNVVYPCVNEEHFGHNIFANRSRETWLFDMSYETSIFFQHYANSAGGPAGLLAVLETLPSSGGQEAQASALKAAGMEEQAFHQFGQTYLDGHIGDACSGTQIPAEGGLGVNETFNLDEVGELETRDLEAGPYTVARYALTMPAERRLLLELQEEDGQGETSSREREARGQWDEFPDDVRTRCEEREIQITLVTTTEIQPPTDYELKLDGETQQASCDGCLLGSWQVNNESFRDYMERAFSSSGTGGDINFDVDSVRGKLLIGFNEEGEMKGRSEDFGLTLTVNTTAMGENFMSTDMNISLTGQATYAADGEIATVFSPQVTTGEEGTARFFDGTTQNIELELTLGEMFALSERLGGPGGQVPTENEVEYQCFDDEGRILWTIPELGTIEYLRTDETVFEDE